jgi:di/tricarboxylate transporter
MAETLDWTAAYTVLVLAGCVVALARDVARPDLVLVGALAAVLVAGIVTPEQAFSGFSNSAIFAIAALFVVAEGLQRTGALSHLDSLLFSRSERPAAYLSRIMIPTSFLSAFLNNTPIVAMLVPRIQEWAERSGVSPSKVLMPLSFAAIVGGMVTLIGTSTNIVVSGLMEEAGIGPMGMFDLTWIGLPAALGVLLYFVLGGHRLLPEGLPAAEPVDSGLKECLFELRVPATSDLVGRTVGEAGLRSLGDAFLAHMRIGPNITTATPEQVIEEGVVLSFVGELGAIDRLIKAHALEKKVASLSSEDGTLPIFEAVVADGSSLVGRTLKQIGFRERFGGVVLAIQRRNERLEGPLGRLRIRAGDLLLIEASGGFDRRWNASRDEFYLVARRRAGRSSPNTRHAPMALVLLLAMVGLVAAGLTPIATAAFAAGIVMIVSGCVSFQQARQSIDVSVLVVIGAALGLGKAVDETGLAAFFAEGLLGLGEVLGPVALLVALYVSTNVLTELITHKAAAVLMFPVALGLAEATGYPPRAMAMIVAIAAAASFATPIGYQTNLMVLSAGGYKGAVDRAVD